MPKRIEYLDVAKGIGILFVVLGHNQIKSDYPIVYQVVYSFHMPFFFLLSGMFFKADYGFSELARRRFSSLLKPFLAYMAVVYAGAIFFSKIDLPTIFGRIFKALYAGPNTLEWVPLWFLPHLFLVNLFAFVLIKFVYDRLAHLWMRISFLVAILGAGVALSAGVELGPGVTTPQIFWPLNFTIFNRDFEFYGLPWSADLLLITTTFFIVGYEIRRTFLDHITDSAYAKWIALAALVLFAGLNIAFDTTIDFYVRRYSFMVNTLEALSASVLILYLAKSLERGPALIFDAFKYLGAASIVLLIFHYVPQDFLYQKLMGMNMNTLLASGLSFCAGVLFPLLMFAWVIRPNLLLSSWFGLKPPEQEVPR
jgi:polysaccharide biosynthesis protein PslL